MPTKTELCNMALSYIGISIELTDVDADATAAAKACLRFYDTSRDDVLRAYPWPFATKIAALAGKAAAPNVEWGFSYTYPADAVAIRKVLNPAIRVSAAKSRVPFRRTDALIWTNVDNASVEYTVRITDTSKFPADFTHLLSLLLASRIGPRLMKGDKLELADRAFKKYEAELAKAASMSQIEERELGEELVVAASPKELICNEALMHLGLDHELQDLETEQTRFARVLRQFYDNSRDKTLRSFPWPMARKVAALTLVAADPTDEWAYSYRYPADCLQLRRILSGSRQDSQTSKIPYLLANDGTGVLIYTDTPNAEAEYTVRLDNPTAYYTGDFKGAFALELALQIAPALVPDVKVRQAVLQEVRFKLSHQMVQAQANMLNEEQSDRELDSEFVRSR